MMTLQALGKAMLYEPGSAVWTLQPVPTPSAQSQRCIAPAIQEQERLFPCREIFRQSPAQGGRNPGLPLWRIAAQIHE